MYGENEEDWLTLKKYKQQESNELNNTIREYEKIEKSAKKGKLKASAQVAKLNATDTSEKGFFEKRKHEKFIQAEKESLSDFDHDIEKAGRLKAEYQKRIEKNRARIKEIDETIKSIRRQKHEKKAKEAKEKKKPSIQKCPKRCTISNIILSCQHGRTLTVPPYEDVVDMPKFHVLAGSDTVNNETAEVVTVAFSGACDHGKA